MLLISGAYALPTDNLVDMNGEKAVIPHEKEKNLVMFWATWCGTCKYKLQKLLPEMDKRKDLGIVTVNMDKNEKRAKHYIKKNKIKVPIFRVKKGTPDEQNIIKKLKITN